MENKHRWPPRLLRTPDASAVRSASLTQLGHWVNIESDISPKVWGWTRANSWSALWWCHTCLFRSLGHESFIPILNNVRWFIDEIHFPVVPCANWSKLQEAPEPGDQRIKAKVAPWDDLHRLGLLKVLHGVAKLRQASLDVVESKLSTTSFTHCDGYTVHILLPLAHWYKIRNKTFCKCV